MSCTCAMLFFYLFKSLFTLVHLTENTAIAKQGLKTMLNLHLSKFPLKNSTLHKLETKWMCDKIMWPTKCHPITDTVCRRKQICMALLQTLLWPTGALLNFFLFHQTMKVVLENFLTKPIPVSRFSYWVKNRHAEQARIQGRWNGWIFTPLFLSPPDGTITFWAVNIVEYISG